MEQKKSPRIAIGLAVIGLVALIAGLALWLMTPKTIYDGYYSAINDHRAPIGKEEYIRDLYVTSGAGRLATCDPGGASVDVIAFGSYQIRGNTICFRELTFYGQREGRFVVLEPDGTYSLTLEFSWKDGGFVLGACHYERMES